MTHATMTAGPDVIVYGATAAGVMAAVAAARAGASVRVAEPGRHVGGMVSGGLSWTDVGRASVVGGLARRFYELVADHYGVRPFGVRGPEPHVAEELLVAMLHRAGAEFCPDEPLTGVKTSGPRVEAIVTAAGSHTGCVFVDASYEGDLMAAAGVPYRVGRESRGTYRETWAGRQPAYRPGKHNFPVTLSPFRDGPAGELLPFIRPPEVDDRGWPAERLGTGDGAVQAYAFRLCMTDRAANGLPVTEPAGYDPARFGLLRRYLGAMGENISAGDLLGLVPGLLPGGKCDVNSIGPFSLNLLDGSNRGYPDGDEPARRAIRERHLAYTREYLYYLTTDPGVPPHIRREMRRWYLCADEFTDSGGWPHQLYVREGRRMLGAVVLTEHDLLGAADQPDAIAVGSYNIDIREVERTWRLLPEYEPVPAVFNEGYLSIEVEPYPIPYRALIPRPEDCENLLVPVCLSASHLAFGSLRTEPTLMALGEAAGAAAALAAIGGLPVQRVGIGRLQRHLVAGGQVISPG
jgi:hypothetical protein